MKPETRSPKMMVKEHHLRSLPDVQVRKPKIKKRKIQEV